MANIIITDSGHCYDLDDVQSGLRYITEQILGAVPSHVLSLMYNAIEHIERQKMAIDMLSKIADAASVVLSQRNGPYLMSDMDATMKAESNLRAALRLRPNAKDQRADAAKEST
jgi:hypothetical protein